MALRTLTTLAALALALVLPAAAPAQGAGDEQYQDPFGDEPSQQQEPTPTATPAPTQAPVQPVQPSQATPAPTAAQAPSAPSTERQLPYTGAEAGWLALAGIVLLAAGVALRRRANHQR